MERITIYPKKELKDWIEATAKKKRKSVNKLILYALEIYQARENTSAIYRLSNKDKKELKKLIKNTTPQYNIIKGGKN